MRAVSAMQSGGRFYAALLCALVCLPPVAAAGETCPPDTRDPQETSERTQSPPSRVSFISRDLRAYRSARNDPFGLGNRFARRVDPAAPRVLERERLAALGLQPLFKRWKRPSMDPDAVEITNPFEDDVAPLETAPSRLSVHVAEVERWSAVAEAATPGENCLCPGGVSPTDCDNNGIADQCELDCGASGGPCDVPGCGLATDCNGNGQIDTCDIGTLPNGCVFPQTLLENTTAVADSVFLGAPDGVYRGLGGQIVTFDLDCTAIVDGLGPDFNVYEAGGAEYSSVDVYVSGDGVDWFNINEGRTPHVPVAGDLSTGAPRGFDLAVTPLRVARFVRLDGVGGGADGSSTGFDLDAIGVIHGLGNDCDNDGAYDACQIADDCNGNRVPEICEYNNNWVDDCDFTGTPDTCDTLGGVDDCDGDRVPDSCENDCDADLVPDECAIAAMTVSDCNGNLIVDECELGAFSFDANINLIPIGGEIPRTWTILSPPAADADLFASVFGFGNFGATNEYVDVLLNGVAVGRLFETDGFDCGGSFGDLIIPADTYNLLVAGGNAVWTFAASAAVDATLCTPTSLNVSLFYDANPDCNLNMTVDGCDIAAMTSSDLNMDGIPDECGVDCNNNGTPDDYDVMQGISPDCNGNVIPDECDVSDMTSDDCNFNNVPDECETDCNSNGTPDDCDISTMTSPDCDGNSVPDECDVAAANACSFGTALLDNGTSGPEENLLGAPDDVYWGLGGQVVTYDLDCAVVADGPGGDFNVYEYAPGSPEFDSLEDVSVSQDGFNFFSVKATEDVATLIPGDEVHDDSNDRRSYDLAASGLAWARYIRLDGAGTGSSGSTTGFDLDAIGLIHTIDGDCDDSGVLDVCETPADCDGSGFSDSCELAVLDGVDCNGNMTLDGCDIAAMTSGDCNADAIPDECQPDCNGNTTPDVCEVAAMTASDCNMNDVLDECEFPSTSVDEDLGTQSPLSDGHPQDFVYGAPFVASGPVTITVTVTGDYGASNEFVDVAVNGANVGQVFASTGLQCSEVTDTVVVPAATFNDLLDGDDAVVTLSVPSVVHSFECAEAYARVQIAYDISQDCNNNGTLDFCDSNGGASGNCNANAYPDDCDLASMTSQDCNGNTVPDECDVATDDCNDNGIPDDCDLASMTSQDCNVDLIPDECPVCPLVEVVFAIDGSASMNDEGEALCADVAQIIVDLQADLVTVQTEILAIDNTLVWSCQQDGVPNRYGTTVPGNPPPGNEFLGDCTGFQSEREDWGPATSVIAGNKVWDPDSVRIVIPISDEGPRCGGGVNDPGDDREAITHAISVATANDVVVSPITGTGSSAAVINIAGDLAAGTGGQSFASTDPVNDLSQGIRDIVFNACDVAGDCNGNDVPDACDISAMTSQDCNVNGVPDECEPDCNMNGIEDSCDLAAMTSADVNANMVPDECEGVILTLDENHLQWTAAIGAIAYDVVQGDLVDLRGLGGDFAASTDACLVNDTAALTEPQPSDPAPGGLQWFLLRAILATGPLSYDTFSPYQAGPRDAEVLASGNDCP